MKLSLVVGVIVCAVVAPLVVLFADNGGVTHVVRASSPVRSQPHQGVVPQPSRATQLADEINRAQRVIDNRSSPSDELARAGLLEQLATASLARETPRARHATLALLQPQAAATVRTDLAASAALSRLTVPQKRFPPWRIAQPPRPATLLAYFRQAASRFGVGWQYLAAIEFIETRFGRIHGPSTAGAQGPMQFLPSTWARYGSGNINNPRDAIIAAARFLVANGARADMAGALFHYNNSTDYVAAVQDYARRMRANPQAYVGYYNWQVIFARGHRAFILPIGYPRVRPEPLHYP